jgi:hypothetical protein
VRGRKVRVRGVPLSKRSERSTCDADAGGSVDGSEPVYWFTHDERWRIVATYRGSDTDPREVFVWNSAGMDGAGGSS